MGQKKTKLEDCVKFYVLFFVSSPSWFENKAMQQHNLSLQEFPLLLQDFTSTITSLRMPPSIL